jgi:hypothetical protein
VVLSHDSDETAVPGGWRRLNRKQGEAKGTVKSSVEGGGGSSRGGKKATKGSGGSSYARRGERMGKGGV